jgi:hypothetical protein
MGLTLLCDLCHFGLKTFFKQCREECSTQLHSVLTVFKKINGDKKCISEPVSFCKYYKLNQISAYPAVSSEVCVLTRPPVHAGIVGT